MRPKSLQRGPCCLQPVSAALPDLDEVGRLMFARFLVKSDILPRPIIRHILKFL